VRKEQGKNIYTNTRMKFSFEIVIIILLIFAVYYLYEQNMYLQRKVKSYTESERDTQDTLDYINEDLLNIKRTLHESKRVDGGILPTQRQRDRTQTPTSTPRPRPVHTSTPKLAPTSTPVARPHTSTSTSTQILSSDSGPVSTSTPVPGSTSTSSNDQIGESIDVQSDTTSIQNVGDLVGNVFSGDSLRNLGNILGRLPRGTVSRTFSMNVPSSMLRGLDNELGDSVVCGEAEPTKTI
jgi:hypothetical protein